MSSYPIPLGRSPRGPAAVDRSNYVPVKEPMPFRKENRMTTFLVLAVLLLCGLAVVGVQVILRYPSANSTPAWVFLGTSVVLALKIMLAMLQTEFATRKLSNEMSHTRHDLRNAMDETTRIVQSAAVELGNKTNGGLTTAVKEVAEQVRLAERDQIINDPTCRKAMEEMAEKAARDASEQTARRMIDELKRGLER